MKRSLWMFVTVAAVAVGLIAVANAQRKLWSLDEEALAANTLWDDPPADPSPAADASEDADPWSDPVVVQADSGGLEPMEGFEHEPSEDMGISEVDLSGSDDTIPMGPGVDFRGMSTTREASYEQEDDADPAGDDAVLEELQGVEPGVASEFPEDSDTPAIDDIGDGDQALEITSEGSPPGLLPPEGPEQREDDLPLLVPEPEVRDVFAEGEEQFEGDANDADGLSDVGVESGDVGTAAVATTDSLEQSAPLGPQRPTLTLEKLAPQVVQFGQSFRYEIVVRNVGDSEAHSVVVRDAIPEGSRLIEAEPRPARQDRRLVWQVGTLEPQQERRFTVEVKPRRDGEIGSVAQVTFSARAAARTLVAQPKVALEIISSTEQARIGDSVTLTFRVSNPGTGPATNVVLVEPIPEQLRHPAGEELEYEIGTLEPGETRDVPLTLQAAQGGRAVNQAKVIADGDLQALASTSVSIVAPQLDVSVDGPRRRYLGRPATYILAVNNPGDMAATGVRIVSYVPEGMEFVEAANGGQFDTRSGTVSWSLAELGGSQSAQVSLSLRPVTPGSKVQRVHATAEHGLEADSQLTTSVEGISAVLLEVVDVEDPIEVGAETTYEVRVVSQGSKSSTNVRLAIEVPEGIEVLQSSGPTGGTVEAGRVAFEPLSKLGPGVDAIYRIRARGLRAGDQRFRVQLTTDQMQTPVREEESTRVYAD